MQINKNRAKLSKLRHDVVVTQNKLRQAGPQAKDAADNCNGNYKLRWNGSAWSCLEESDHHANPYAEQDLPICPDGHVLTSTSTTALGCNAPEKGPIGPAPTWRKPNGGDNLQVQNPGGGWGSSIYIRGDPGDTYTWYTGAYGGCSETSCGPGTRTRVVECRKNTFTTVPNSQCASPKPTNTTSCHAGWSYSWTGYSAWSSCNSSCSQSRTRDCKRCDGTTVADSYCSGSATDSRSCTGGYSWTSYGSWSSWSSCNSSCQQSRSRTRTCRRNCDNAAVSAGNCSGSATHTESSSCTGGYSWSGWSSWSTCSSSCTQNRSRSCRKNCNNATVSSGYCSGSATQSQNCSSGNCSQGCTFTYYDGGNVSVADGSSVTAYEMDHGMKGMPCTPTHTCNNGSMSNGSGGWQNCKMCGSYDPMWCEENVW